MHDMDNNFNNDYNYISVNNYQMLTNYYSIKVHLLKQLAFGKLTTLTSVVSNFNSLKTNSSNNNMITASYVYMQDLYIIRFFWNLLAKYVHIYLVFQNITCPLTLQSFNFYTTKAQCKQDNTWYTALQLTSVLWLRLCTQVHRHLHDITIKEGNLHKLVCYT